jgi:hypothetical protein
MYKIIGNDGKAYGPVTAEKIREWISQGRVDDRTSVIRDGATEWTFIGLLPEFTPLFSAPPHLITPQKIGALATRTTNGFATAGFVCGIISCACCCGCPFNILGLIFSIIALVQINAQTQKQEGRGLALAGLICSAASLLFNLGFEIFHLIMTPTNISWQIGSI